MFFVTDCTLTGHDGQTLVEVGEILTVEAIHARTPHEDATLPGIWCFDTATAERVRAETIRSWKTRFAADMAKLV